MMATYPKLLMLTLLATATFVGTGCATAPTQTQPDEKEKAYSELQARLMESERLNKRLDRKIGHLEQALAATQDKIEAQTLASQFEQHQPDPVPESRFSNGFTQERRYAQASRPNAALPVRRERRISLSPNHYVPPGSSGIEFYSDSDQMPEDASPETVIITQEDLDALDRGASRARRRSANRGGATTVITEPRRRIAQPDVTDERLPVTKSVVAESTPQKVAPKPAKPTLVEKPTAPPKASAAAPEAVEKKEVSVAAKAGTFTSAPQKTPQVARVNGMVVPPQPAVDDASLQIYEEGLNLYRGGDFKSSLDRFNQFLKSKPAPSYLDNALYWIGESYYGLNNMPKSIQYFKRVVSETPTGNKVPNAMLKMAIAYRNLGQEKKSQNMLKKLVQQFPSSGAGQIAKRELEK